MKKDLFSDIRPVSRSAAKKPVTFAEDLFKHLDNSLWTLETDNSKEAPLTEKSLVLNSAKQFIEEKVVSHAPKPVKIMGAEVSLKNDNLGKQLSDQNYPTLALADLQKLCNSTLDSSIAEYRYQDKTITPVDYLFVSDNFYHQTSITEPSTLKFMNKIVPYFFQKEAAILFSNMAKALGSAEDKIALTSLKTEQKSNIEDLFYHELSYFQPKVIITLGARVTNSLLKERKRIAEVHGQFFEISIIQNGSKASYPVMPLFHPEFLWANPNMKAAAWNDLQSAIKLIRSK